MSIISSNSLFHFTPRAEYLIGILTNDFHPRYCYEEISLTSSEEIKATKKVQCAIPMVCFCDIPLGQIKNHIKTYGSYGLGMTKEWGIKMNLNPLIYLNQNSQLSNSISQIGEILNDRILNSDGTGKSESAMIEFLKLSKYLKHYEGDFLRNGVLMENIRFYNEREWRYVPHLDDDKDVENVLRKKEFENPIRLAQENNKVKKYSLEFAPNDIKYIFVKDESEIHSTIEAIREIKSAKYLAKDIDVLTSKILTSKQLIEDF